VLYLVGVPGSSSARHGALKTYNLTALNFSNKKRG